MAHKRNSDSFEFGERGFHPCPSHSKLLSRCVEPRCGFLFHSAEIFLRRPHLKNSWQQLSERSPECVGRCGAKDTTTQKNADARQLYDHLLTIQNAADLQWPAHDPANAGVGGEFQLGIFPPDHGGNHTPAPTPTPSTTPAN